MSSGYLCNQYHPEAKSKDASRPPLEIIPLSCQCQWEYQMHLQKVWHKSDLQIRTDSSLDVNQSQGYTAFEKTIQYSVPDPLHLWEDLHWWDQAKAEDDDQGTPQRMWEGSDGEVSYSTACMGKPTPHQMGGVSVVDQARRPKELALKEALHIQLTLLKSSSIKIWG